MRLNAREQKVYDVLDMEAGTEAFQVAMMTGGSRRTATLVLSRLRVKGLAEPVRCDDGAWVWFKLTGDDSR